MQNNKMKNMLMVLLLLILSVVMQGQTLLVQESFNIDEGGYYEQYFANTFNDGASDYFSPFSTATAPTGWPREFFNSDGNYFFGAEDLDDIENPLQPDINGYIVIDRQDVSAFSQVQVTIALAAVFDDLNDLSFEEDQPDGIFIQYAFDGNIAIEGPSTVNTGTYTTIGQFKGGSGSIPSPLLVDSDLDGQGDGTLLDETFYDFTYTFDTNGATDVSIRIRVDCDLSEEIGIDNIRVYGVGSSNSAPTASSFTASPIYQDTAYAFATADFGYFDGDSDPLNHLRVVSEPSKVSNGYLWVDSDNSGSINGAESALYNGDTVSKADLDAGRLKYLNILGYSSSFTFDVNDGTEYSASTYTATLTVTPTPTATTDAATGIGTTTATLNGTVNANNVSTTVTFQYGLDAGYGSTVTADQSPVTGSSDTPVSKAITSLIPNTTYHYRVVGSSTGGTTYGDDISFTTDPLPPSLTTDPANNIGTTSAMLNGSANANGATTSLTFEYGLDIAYGTSITPPVSPITGTSSMPVNETITDLTPYTTYHYRMIGTNAGGTTNGDDVTFTTLGIVPTVTTQAVDNILFTTATGNGDITYLGVPDPTAYGVCWNTVGSPTTSDDLTDEGATSTIGIFSTEMTGLTKNTMYYVRAYAENTADTVYGDEVSFTTLDHPFAGGNGTEIEPLQITSVIELQAVRNYLTYNFIVMNDIDASSTSSWKDSGSGFQPIGIDQDPANQFTGTIDGQGFTISGMYINRPFSEFCGLFGIVGTDAKISNIVLENVNITGRYFSGGLVAINYGTIENCGVSGSVTDLEGTLVGTGGLVGRNNGSISRSYSTADVSGTQYVGGFTGNNLGSITDCYSRGSATFSGNAYCGGFTGRAESGIFTNCYSTGTPSGSSDVGGFAGYADTKGVVSCYWDMEASGSLQSSAGIGKTTSEMKDGSTFVDWDFDSPVWFIDPAYNDGYPALDWQDYRVNFHTTQKEHYLGTQIQFTDKSSGHPDSWEWDFENDGNPDSFDQDPLFEYPEAGVYTVKLTATYSDTTITEIKTDYITVNTPGLMQGLIAYYPFDGNADDYSGLGNDGDNFGAVDAANRFSDTVAAFEFDGTSTYVKAGVNPGDLDSVTISLWFNNKGGDGNSYQMDTLFGLSRSGDSADIMVGINDSDQVGVYISEVGGIDFYSTDSYLNEWHHLTFLYSNSNWVELYIDGRLIEHGIIDSEWYSGLLPIGDALYSYDENFLGTIDEVRIYNRFLSEDEINELYFENGWGYGPENISTEISGNDLILSWDAVAGAVSYKIYASDEPYGTFNDVSGEGVFVGESWTYPYTGTKRFFYVVAEDSGGGK